MPRACNAKIANTLAIKSATRKSSQNASANQMQRAIPTKRKSTIEFPIGLRNSQIWVPIGVAIADTCYLLAARVVESVLVSF